MVFFAVKLAVQLLLFQVAEGVALAVPNVFLGWPATIVLALSYFYGLWRLGRLHRPGVAGYEAGVDPPWTGQCRGF
jgi:hypothetical protein